MSRIARLLLPVLAALGACSRPYDGPYKHVVLISLDTTRADHLGCYGNTRVKTPSLDRLAREGVLFRDVTTAAPTTLASHTSIMTGTYPHTHGVERNAFTVNSKNEMLAEILADEGFHTAGFIGSMALESTFRFDQGFDAFDERFDMELENPHQLDQDQRRADRVTDAVLAHLDDPSVRAVDRLFLFVHYFDAHAPYDPPEPYASRYALPGGPTTSDLNDLGRAQRVHRRSIDPEASGDPVETGLSRTEIEGATGEPHPGRPVRKATGEVRPGDLDLAALYEGEIAYLDEHLGRLLDGLAERGILDDAIVVVTGDHGETFWEHGDSWNHGLWVYQTTVHVPLLVRLPAKESAGNVVDVPVSTIDILPTLCELLGIERPERAEGASLVPAIRGEPFERGAVFSEATQPWRLDRDVLAGANPKAPRFWANGYKPQCVRVGACKYVRAPYLQLEELYDLEHDPGERTNLVGATGGCAGDVERLRAVLQRWSEEADPLPSGYDPSQVQRILERLKGLGYGGGGEEEKDD